MDRRSITQDPVVSGLLRRCTFPPADTAVTCAVSGGADSSALVVLAVAAGLEVTAVHVDHAIRSGSAAEALLVAELAGRLGVGFRAVRAPVSPGPGLEARARTVRHGAVGPDALFGHTADDQAETVLLRMLRGTGTTGLSAMRTERHPLLALRRSETVELCEHLGLEVLRDPSNDSPAFTRNRVRHEVIPLLDDVAGRDVVPLLSRLARIAAEQSDLIEELARPLDPTDAAALAAAPRSLASAAVRRWWRERSGEALAPDEHAIERVLEVAAGTAVACDVLGGWRVLRSRGRLRMERHPDPC
ncbi:MAG: tRNA lysidine(34) synthetase TilS [Actinobacteria bacterium]|nr:tRNA lysidine(34) synthetase TilS [Actinomycetota bacterium]